MNELDLIKSYLEREHTKVIDAFYIHKHHLITVDHDYVPVGKDYGYALTEDEKKMYFFGNVTLEVRLAGVVTLANKNIINCSFETIGRTVQGSGGTMTFAVGHNLSLLGDGTYLGIERLYAMGFTRMTINKDTLGAATFLVSVEFNGFLFRLE